MDAINCVLNAPFDVPDRCDPKQLRIYMILSFMFSGSLGAGAYIDLTQFDLDA